jgi:probable rRNA maturation factor
MINFISEKYPDLNLGKLIEITVSGVFTSLDKKMGGDVSIVIVGDEEILQLNQEFAATNSPTDVLSFPSGEIDPDSGDIYYGDIVISYPHAEAQAVTAGHPVTAEIQLLVIHGMLHLLDFDHLEDEEKKEMWSVQKDILDKLNVPLAKYPE